jgi:hypothetical protein
MQICHAEEVVSATSVSKAENADCEPKSADCAAAAIQMEEAVADHIAPGSVETPVAKALWAIQNWYEELGDESRADSDLADRHRPEWAASVPD